jgi:hypothetical protein
MSNLVSAEPLLNLRIFRLMTHTTSFFDFVLILVTAGALAIILTIMLYVTLQSRRSRN